MNTGVQDLSALDEFHRSFAAYQVWAKKDQGALVEDRGQKVRLELFKQFRRLAMSKEDLRADVVRRGFAIRRRVRGELAAEYPAAAAVGAVPRVSLAEELKFRIKSLRFLSVSFVTRAWRTAREGQSARFSARNRAQKEIGSALIRASRGVESPFVSLTSMLDGVVKQDRQRAIADRALLAQSADMADYVRRKHQEKLAAIFTRPFEAAISA